MNVKINKNNNLIKIMNQYKCKIMAIVIINIKNASRSFN